MRTAGFRAAELRIKDVDLENSRLTIRDAKGGKSRVVPLPCSLIALIHEQMQRARLLWEADQLKRVPVPLPGRLGTKYPKAAGSWAWYWLFPAHRPCKHPRSGEVVRWRIHESNVQRAVRSAARKCDLEGAVTPHVLRHAYATHVMQQGAYVRDVQVILGHNSLETTMQYLHTEAGRVQSPLESLSLSSNQPQAAVQLKDRASTVATPPVPQGGFTSTGDRLNQRAEVDALLTNTETRPISRERSYSPSRAADQSRRTGTGLSRGERLNDTANNHRRSVLDSTSRRHRLFSTLPT